MKKIFFLLIILGFNLQNHAQTCLSGDCNNGIGKMEFKTETANFIYEGVFKDGELHGKGTATFRKPLPKFNVTDESYLQLLKFEGEFVHNEPGQGDFYPLEYNGGKLTGKMGEGDLFDGKYLHTKKTGETEYITFAKGKVVKTEPIGGAVANNTNNTSTANTNFPPIAEPKNGAEALVNLFATFQEEIIKDITKGAKTEKPIFTLESDRFFAFYKLPYTILGAKEANVMQDVRGLKNSLLKDPHTFHKAIFQLNDENTRLHPDSMAVYLARNLGRDAGFSLYFKQLDPTEMVSNNFVETELIDYAYPSAVLASWVQIKSYQLPDNINPSYEMRRYLQTLYKNRYMHIDLVKSIQHLNNKSYYKLNLIVELRELNNKPALNQSPEIANFEWLVTPKYDIINDFSDGLAMFNNTDNLKKGYLDKAGKVVIVPNYKVAEDFTEGLACVGNGGFFDSEWGFIDKKGSIIIPFQYKGASPFSEGLAAVNQEGKWGYIDKTGKVVIPTQYKNARAFSEGLAAVYNDGKWGYIDKTGKMVIPVQYEEVGGFSEGLAAIKKDKTCGYIDKTGKVVIEPQFDKADRFSEGMAKISQSYKSGYIDKTGKIIIPPQYDDADRFSEGLASVDDGEYIDKTGKVIRSTLYSSTYSFSEGLARVKLGNYWGIIDKTGKELIKPQFDAIGTVKDGIARVKKGGKYGVIKILKK